MVQSGHMPHAAPPPSTLVAGDVPPPPPGELVPHEGYIVFTGRDHREAFAGYVLAVHLPGSSQIEVRAWPPKVKVHRRCTWCSSAFPCTAVQWATGALNPEGPADPATPAPPHKQPDWNAPTEIIWPDTGLLTTPAQQLRGNGGRR